MNEKIPQERVIVKEIMAWLKKQRYAFVHKSHGSAYARTGLPDIVVIDRYGRFVGLEVKRPVIGRLTAIQARILNKINAAGGYAEVVHSVEEVEQAMAAAEAGMEIMNDYVAGKG